MSITHPTAADGTFSSGGATAWDEAHAIADDTLVAAKLAASATDVLFGRSTAGAGAGEEIPCTAVGRAALGASTNRAAASNLAVAYILAKSAVAVSGAADTNENTLATITIPANALGANGQIEAKFTVIWTASANNKTFRVRFSGAAGTILLSDVVTTGGANGRTYTVLMGNRNDASSQFCKAWTATGAQFTPVTAAIDTTAETTVVLTAQKALGTEAVTVEMYSCLLLSDGT